MFIVENLIKLGEGGYKAVYAHPDDPKKVIKVIRHQRVSADGCFKKHGRWKRHSMQGMYRQFRRELLQYLQLCKNSYNQKRFIFPIETSYGFVQTNRGLGFVVERVVGPSGSGETLFDLCESGRVEKKHIQALERFFQQCCELHLVFGEVNSEGLMYTESRTGIPEFVLVDGIGEKLIIPVRTWIKSNNDRYIRKVEKKIKEQHQLYY